MKHTVDSMIATIKLIIDDKSISYEESIKQIEKYLKEIERDRKENE